MDTKMPSDNEFRFRVVLGQDQKIVAGTDCSGRIVCPVCGKATEWDKNNFDEAEPSCEHIYMIPDIDWFCDNCEAYMNEQPGFCISDDTWICTECGFENDVSESNLR